MSRDKVQIGIVTIGQGCTSRETYEYAAWFRLHKLEAGDYPVFAIVNPQTTYEKCLAFAYVPSKIVDACLQSGFGGIGYGEDRAGKAEIGRAETRTITLWREADGKRTTWAFAAKELA
jgi:hypothetical protein